MNKKTLAILSALAFSGLTQAQSLQQDSPSQAKTLHKMITTATAVSNMKTSVRKVFSLKY